jgi:hypothetical protein
MANVLEGYTTEQKRSVVGFLLAEGLNEKLIRKEMSPIF